MDTIEDHWMQIAREAYSVYAQARLPGGRPVDWSFLSSEERSGWSAAVRHGAQLAEARSARYPDVIWAVCVGAVGKTVYLTEASTPGKPEWNALSGSGRSFPTSTEALAWAVEILGERGSYALAKIPRASEEEFSGAAPSASIDLVKRSTDAARDKLGEAKDAFAQSPVTDDSDAISALTDAVGELLVAVRAIAERSRA